MAHGPNFDGRSLYFRAPATAWSAPGSAKKSVEPGRAAAVQLPYSLPGSLDGHLMDIINRAHNTSAEVPLLKLQC